MPVPSRPPLDALPIACLLRRLPVPHIYRSPALARHLRNPYEYLGPPSTLVRLSKGNQIPIEPSNKAYPVYLLSVVYGSNTQENGKSDDRLDYSLQLVLTAG
jgi:hypothetical protein